MKPSGISRPSRTAFRIQVRECGQQSRYSSSPQNACRKIARLKVSQDTSDCMRRSFLLSIGIGLRTPCSRLLPYDLDALTRP